jgi:hypothetical protein
VSVVLDGPGRTESFKSVIKLDRPNQPQSPTGPASHKPTKSQFIPSSPLFFYFENVPFPPPATSSSRAQPSPVGARLPVPPALILARTEALALAFLRSPPPPRPVSVGAVRHGQLNDARQVLVSLLLHPYSCTNCYSCSIHRTDSYYCLIRAILGPFNSCARCSSC